MWATDWKSTPVRRPRHPAQRGVAAVEFALLSLLFFTLVFAILELARIVYMFNTLPDVTRTAAHAVANIDWRNDAALAAARQRAVFRDSPGTLPFGAPVTDQNIRIDYLYLKQDGTSLDMVPVPAGSMPTCPGRNRHNCMTNPYSGAAGSTDYCIRLVRVRICRTDGATCEPLTYQSLFPLIPVPLPLPTSTTIVSAETLGYRPGDPVCP